MAIVERDLMTYPTWERYTVLAHFIFTLNVRDRRNIFHLCRSMPSGKDLFFPKYGLTFSEFAVWYTLGDTKRKTTTH